MVGFLQKVYSFWLEVFWVESEFSTEYELDRNAWHIIWFCIEMVCRRGWNVLKVNV